MACI
jgi:hypothetical protein